MISLGLPWALLLLPLPVVVHLGLPAYRKSPAAVRVPDLQRLADLSGQTPNAGAMVAPRSRWQWIILCAIWVALVLALARPQWLEPPVVREQSMRDLLLAVDLSSSMEAEDFTDPQGRMVDRLTAVKQVLDDFLSRRQGDRVGLIVFGSAVFVQVPFTEDLNVLRILLDELQVRMAGPKTALGDAVGLAMTLFEGSEVDQKVLIVLTDGNDTGSLVPPARAAEIARDNGIVIHTVAVGDPATVGEEQLDTASLVTVADVTGGRYFFAADRDQLEQIYSELDALNPRQVETLSFRPQRDLFQWPLGLALALSFLVAAVAVSRVILPRRWSSAGAA